MVKEAMNNQTGIAADIRFGVHSRLDGIAAHIDKCVTDYAHGCLYPQDGDYDYIMQELRRVREQLREFIDAKERVMRAQLPTKGGQDGS